MLPTMAAPDIATIQALRIDVALQITRFMRRRGLNQLVAAKVSVSPAYSEQDREWSRGGPIA